MPTKEDLELVIKTERQLCEIKEDFNNRFGEIVFCIMNTVYEITNGYWFNYGTSEESVNQEPSIFYGCKVCEWFYEITQQDALEKRTKSKYYKISSLFNFLSEIPKEWFFDDFDFKSEINRIAETEYKKYMDKKNKNKAVGKIKREKTKEINKKVKEYKEQLKKELQ